MPGFKAAYCIHSHSNVLYSDLYILSYSLHEDRYQIQGTLTLSLVLELHLNSLTPAMEVMTHVWSLSSEVDQDAQTPYQI